MSNTVESNNIASGGTAGQRGQRSIGRRLGGAGGTKFTISSPASLAKDGGELEQGVGGGRSGVEDGDGPGGIETQPAAEDGNHGERQQEQGPDLLFKKKDVRRSRTQSVQSVLSSASLKSLKQQYTNTQQCAAGQQRTNSFVSTHSNPNTAKNFQSFIQAPVLSSVSNLRTNGDDIEIGQRLPFSNASGNSLGDSNGNDNGADGLSTSSSNEDDDGADQDTMMQQQKLTMNALRKLTLSPMPIINSEESLPPGRRLPRRLSSKLTDKSSRSTELYQPAEVDLSSFASLTRQPKLTPNEIKNVPSNSGNGETSHAVSKSANSLNGATSNAPSNKSATPKRAPALPSLIEQSDSSINSNPDANVTSTQMLATQRYHSEVHQNHLQNVREHIKDLSGVKPVAHVTGPSSLSDARRKSGQQVPLQQPVPRPQHQPYQPNKPRVNKQLQQINSLRSPMYIPAVLRMTQDMSRSQSVTSSSLNGSCASQNNDSVDTDPRESPEATPSAQYPLHQHALKENLTSTSSRGSLNSVDSFRSTDSSSPPPISPTGPFTISKRKYETILRQSPTRKHWVRDESVNKCGIPACSKVFNFFERRHHCRKCGGIYCKEHTSHYLYINHLAQFTTGGRGTLSKVCDNCIGEYNDFMKHEFGVSINPIRSRKTTNPKPSRINNKQQYTEKLGKLPNESLIKNINKLKLDDSNTTNKNDQPVGSVPANWSWSSF